MKHWITSITALSLVLTVATAGMPTTASAQDDTDGPRAQPRTDRALPLTVPPITLGRMLVEGQGMGVLQLGTTFARVLIDFGQPGDERKTGLLGKIRNWIYSVDDGSVVVVSGEDETVDTISVTGGLNSTFATIDGITFGSDRSLVLTYYGRPENTRGNSLEYPQKGISFELTDDGLVKVITVTQPEI